MLKEIEKVTGIDIYNIENQVGRYKEKMELKKDLLDRYREVFRDRSKDLKIETVEDVCDILYSGYRKIDPELITSERKQYKIKKKKCDYYEYKVSKEYLKEIYYVWKYRMDIRNVDLKYLDYLGIKYEMPKERDDFIDL